MRLLRGALWILVVAVGVLALGVVAMARGEPVGAVWLGSNPPDCAAA